MNKRFLILLAPIALMATADVDAAGAAGAAKALAVVGGAVATAAGINAATEKTPRQVEPRVLLPLERVVLGSLADAASAVAAVGQQASFESAHTENIAQLTHAADEAETAVKAQQSKCNKLCTPQSIQPGCNACIAELGTFMGRSLNAQFNVQKAREELHRAPATK